MSVVHAAIAAPFATGQLSLPFFLRIPDSNGDAGFRDGIGGEPGEALLKRRGSAAGGKGQPMS